MANKLAGQRAKFSRARAVYHSSSEDETRDRAASLMAEVIRDAPGSGFTVDEVTQQEDVPAEVLVRLTASDSGKHPLQETNGAALPDREFVDIADAQHVGSGREAVYAYSYACTPDRMKIGRTNGDVISRISAQISTSTPDRPKLLLVISTNNASSLERALHAVLELKGARIEGAGAEWFRTTPPHVLQLWRSLMAETKQ